MSIFILIYVKFFSFSDKKSKTLNDLNSEIDDIDKEISVYRNQLNFSYNTIWLNKLANAYLEKAKSSNDPSWYILASQTVDKSFNQMKEINYDANIIQAKIFMAKHEFKKAINLAEKNLDSNLHRINALGIIFDANLAMGNIDLAKKTIFHINETRKTLNRFKSISKHQTLDGYLSNSFSIDLARKGLVNFYTGNEDEAERYFRKAINLELGNKTILNAWLHCLYADFLINYGDYDDSLIYINNALSFFPKYDFAITLKAKVYFQKGEWENFLRFVENKENKSSHISLYLLKVYKVLGKKSEFNSLLSNLEEKLVSELEIGSFGHRVDYIDLLIEKGNSESIILAKKLIIEELKIRKDFKTLFLAIKLCLLNKEYAKTSEYISLIESNGFENSNLFFYKGIVSEKSLLKDYAIKYYQKSLEINPLFDSIKVSYIKDYLQND